MNKLNKIVSNYPVSLNKDEVANLSSTLLPVIEACGGGGGGGITQYYGDGTYTEITGSHVITLTNETKQKINRTIPTKVSDLTDSANYQTTAEMASYETTQHASQTYLTKSSADDDYAPLSTTADVEALKEVSGDFSLYYPKTQTSSYSELSTEFAKYASKSDIETVSGNLNTLSSNVNTKYVTNRSLEETLNSYATKTYVAQQIANKQNKLTFGYDENNAISSIDGTALAGNGGTTYSAGQYINIDSNDTISVTGLMALDEYAQYEPVLMGDSNITATSSKIGTHTQWNLAINSTPVVTDTKLVGENSITAHTTNVSGEWLVGLEQTAHNAIASIDGISTDVGTLKTASAGWNAKVDQSDLNGYLTKTQYGTDSATFALRTQLDEYATKVYANNASANALSEAETWVENKHYLTSVPDTYALKTDIPTTVVQLTDSGNYYQKTETSSKTEITNALNTKLDSTAAAQTYQTISDMTNYLTTSDAATTYQPKGNYLVADDITGKLDKSIYANASGNWEASYNVLTSYSAAGTWLTAHQSLTNYYTKSETSGAGELSTEFAKYVTSSNVSTQDANYVMTTTGWKVLTLPGGGMTQVIHDDTLTGQGNDANSKLGLSQTAYNAITSVSSKLDTTAFSTVSGKFLTAHQSLDNYYTITQVDSTFASATQLNDYLTTAQYQTDSGTFLTKSSADNDYAPLSITATVNTLTAASAGWNNKVDKPTSLNDKYLVLRTDTNGAVSGWEDLKNECYSKTEATGTFVATANIDTTTLSGDGKTSSTKLGVKTDVIATKDYVSGNYLPTSGGTVSGQLVVSGGGTFDQQFLKLTRENVNGYGRIGLGSSGPLALKVDDANSHTTQINISPNTTNDQLVQVQHGGTTAYLIPAVTSTTTAGLTNDGILHIILES